MASDAVPSPAAPTPLPASAAAPRPALGLGLDVGGTSTRWALADADGRLHAQGDLPGFTAALLGQVHGQQAAAEVMAALALRVRGNGHPVGRPLALGPVGAVCAGVTGTDRAGGTLLRRMLAQALGVAGARIEVTSDIEMACHVAFAPGAGFLVYAGTGSIAGHVDAGGHFHRAGGRGGLIDDGGSAHWIARQALRRIWRAEDAEPGAWRRSGLARRVLAVIAREAGEGVDLDNDLGDWALSRHWLAHASRGEIGLLARAVAAADGPAGTEQADADAAAILDEAGRELARLALALSRRFGPRPVALAGRAFLLSPRIAAAMSAALPDTLPVTQAPLAEESTAAGAARRAARQMGDLAGASA